MAKNNDDEDSEFDFDETDHEEESDFDFSDDSDFDFEDDTEIEEETETEAKAEEGDTPAAAPVPPAAAPVQKAAAPAPSTPPAGEEVGIEKEELTTTSPKDIPLHIAVEVGRFHMSIEKMMDLQPGNMLNLQVRPEDGVDLVVNGKRIGRGELLKFGETLGIRITEVG